MSSHSVTNNSDVFAENRKANDVQWTLYVPEKFPGAYGNFASCLSALNNSAQFMFMYIHEI